jgi:hypothetical protein
VHWCQVVTHTRANDGVVNHTYHAELVQRIPNATFQDATDVVGFARYSKSKEEIDCLRRAAAIAEAAIDAMVAVAKPGAEVSTRFARVARRCWERSLPHPAFRGPSSRRCRRYRVTTPRFPVTRGRQGI